MNKLTMYILIGICVFSFIFFIWAILTPEKAIGETDNISIEKSIELETIADNLQHEAEKCTDIEDFCNLLDEKSITPAYDDISRDSLIIYYTYTFNDSSKLAISTNRTTRKIIGVKVVENE